FVRALEVQHQAALAAVHAEESAALGLQGGRVVAQVVAAGGVDLDHVRALVGQQRAAVGAGDVGTEGEHADAAERARVAAAVLGEHRAQWGLRRFVHGRGSGKSRPRPGAGTAPTPIFNAQGNLLAGRVFTSPRN